VDGAVEGTGGGAGRIGAVLSQLESGNVQSYVTGLLAAVVLLGLVAVLV
jgi:NADH-quinone oxidoreductase subunit L